MSNSQCPPGNLYLIKTVKNIVTFLGLKVFNYVFSCSRNAQVIFVIKLQLKLKISNLKDKAVKGIIVNRALLFLHIGPLQISLTVPLLNKILISCFIRRRMKSRRRFQSEELNPRLIQMELMKDMLSILSDLILIRVFIN